MRNHPDLPADAPQWLREADVELPVWRGGEWHDGVWRGGVWRGGVWRGGEWRGGVWRGGEWRGGEWRGGEWRGGEWLDKKTPDRLLFMAAMLGIVFDECGYARAYRTTQANGRGRYTKDFVQPEGEYYESDACPAGRGTCVSGIHVTSAARAWTYFGIDTTCQLWAVDFTRDDLLDCDGEKARIRGGTFMRIATPWVPK